MRLGYKLRSPCVYTHAKRSHKHIKDPVVHVTVQWIMETPNLCSLKFGGLWKHQTYVVLSSVDYGNTKLM